MSWILDASNLPDDDDEFGYVFVVDQRRVTAQQTQQKRVSE